MTERCRGPLHRRAFLQAGFLTLGGLSLPGILRAREASGNAKRETSVIFLYLVGGASQLETYDLKPDAPIEYRSVFKPIATKVPGMAICEHLPLHAKVADKFALIRSCHHTMNAHNDGGIEVLTGKTPTRPDPTSTSLSEHPDFGSIVSKMRGLHPEGLPRYVGLPGNLGMTRPVYLGLQHRAFSAGDPSQPFYAPPSMRLSVPPQRLDDRKGLLRTFDIARNEVDRSGVMEAQDQFRGVAYQMLTSTRTATAFDMKRESDRTRERYGNHLWGQSCLLARRLAEAGVGAITIGINVPKNGPEFTNWDDHIMNAMRPGHFGMYMETRFPYYDQALSALIEDVYDRGLDRDVMIVAMGEFGRTPRLSRNAQGVGRDHWPDAQSVLISGGGLKMGQVIGATNGKAEFPTQRPCSPKDVLATIYRHLGIDVKHEFLDHTGRPVAILNEGSPIDELG